MTLKKSERKKVKLSTSFVPQFWVNTDRRVGAVRVIRERYEQLRDDCGVENVQRDLLCQRAAFLAIRLETLEVDAVQTGQFDAGLYSVLSNALLGLLKALGLDRKVKTGTLDLKAYIKERAS